MCGLARVQKVKQLKLSAVVYGFPFRIPCFVISYEDAVLINALTSLFR